MIGRRPLAILAVLLLALFVGAALPRAIERPAGNETHLGAPDLETMPKKPKPAAVTPLRGSLEERGGVYSLRVRVAGERKRLRIGLVSDMTRARAEETAASWLERMAIEDYGEAPPAPSSAATVREHFNAWTSGELYRAHGPVNGLRVKASADSDAWRAGRYVFPGIGAKPIVDVTGEDIDRIMAGIPDELAGTRVKVYALLRRGFDLAIMPGRLRADNPVTRYHRPARSAPKLFAYLFPEELFAVLRCREVPIGRRVMYAAAVYTGLRKSSLFALTWKGWDAGSRTIVSRVSKTGIAQMFEVPPGLAWVLRRWRAYLGDPGNASPIVPREELQIRVSRNGEAEALRADLRAAGVTRAALFPDDATEEPSAKSAGPRNMEPLRFHDLRATFVTWAKRDGKGDGWISDRTGHLTPEMISRYSRAARTLEDLKILPFPDLTGSIPELREEPDAGPNGEPSAGPGEGAAEPAKSASTVAASTSPSVVEASPDVATGLDVDAAHGRNEGPWTRTQPADPHGLRGAQRRATRARKRLKSSRSRRVGLPCGSRCRGFKPRYSPRLVSMGPQAAPNPGALRAPL
jgi:integrase